MLADRPKRVIAASGVRRLAGALDAVGRPRYPGIQSGGKPPHSKLPSDHSVEIPRTGVEAVEQIAEVLQSMRQQVHHTLGFLQLADHPEHLRFE